MQNTGMPAVRPLTARPNSSRTVATRQMSALSVCCPLINCRLPLVGKVIHTRCGCMICWGECRCVLWVRRSETACLCPFPLFSFSLVIARQKVSRSNSSRLPQQTVVRGILLPNRRAPGVGGPWLTATSKSFMFLDPHKPRKLTRMY